MYIYVALDSQDDTLFVRQTRFCLIYLNLEHIEEMMIVSKISTLLLHADIFIAEFIQVSIRINFNPSVSSHTVRSRILDDSFDKAFLHRAVSIYFKILLPF